MRYLTLLFLFTITASAADSYFIAASNRVYWEKGVNVGSLVGSIYRTSISNVTLHGVRNDGVTNCSVELQAMFDNAIAGEVIYFPDGLYCLSNTVTCNKSDITLRGQSTNAVILNLSGSPVHFGHDAVYVAQADYFWCANVDKGSTVLGLRYVTNLSGTTIAAGDSFYISSLAVPSETWHYNTTYAINTNGGHDLFSEHVVVKAVSGTNVELLLPLTVGYSNEVRLRSTSTLDNRSGTNMKTNFGVENLTITCTNSDGRWANPQFLVTASMLRNSWFTNLNVWYAANWVFAFNDNINCELQHSDIGFSLNPANPSHSGLLLAFVTGCLFEDNIFRENFPLVEWNNGVMGNAFFANFYTNTLSILGPDCHNVHPMMNLWEQEYAPGLAFQTDSYFGSTSHNTLFKCHFFFFALKKWTTHFQLIGNVVGDFNNFSYTYGQVINSGLPNGFNEDYNGTSPSAAWNWPSAGAHSSAGGYTNLGFALTNNHVNTRFIDGDLSYVICSNENPGIFTSFPLTFQDNSNTNLYHNFGSSYQPPTAITAERPIISCLCMTNNGTNIVLNMPVTVNTGWRVYMTGVGMWQQKQVESQTTNNVIHGNRVLTNSPIGTLVWDSNIANHTISNSLLYPNGYPGWWGTNRATGAINSEDSNPVTPIPAFDRWRGLVGPGQGQANRIGKGRGFKQRP